MIQNFKKNTKLIKPTWADLELVSQKVTSIQCIIVCMNSPERQKQREITSINRSQQ